MSAPGWYNDIANFFNDPAGDLGLAADIGNVMREEIWQAVSQMQSFLANAIDNLYSALAGVFQGAATLFGSIYNWLKNFWTNIVKRFLTNFLNWVAKILRWIQAKVKPIIDFLQKLQKRLDAYYNHVIKPFINAIQHVRQGLTIFRLLGFKWAQKLDQQLAQIQAKTINAFNQVRGTLNTIVGFVNLAFMPTNLMRSPVWMASMRITLAASIRLVTGMPPGYFLPSPQGAKGGSFTPPKLGFDASSPLENPPPSAYLSGNDGVPSLGFASGDAPPDDSVADDFLPLDAFNDALYPQTSCDDPLLCLVSAINSATSTIGK